MLDRRAKRRDRYQRVVELHSGGLSARAIARIMGIDRETVSRFLRAGSFPERAGRRLVRPIDKFLGKLRELWDGGVHNAAALYRTIGAAGFTGSAQMVRRRVATWRASPAGREALRSHEVRPTRISSTRLSWLLLKDDVERDAGEQRLIDDLRARCDEVRIATQLGREFNTIMSERRLDALVAWTERCMAAGVPEELRSFAEGLRRDWPSVKAAVQLKWNNGRAEGHVNRIKLIKRKMYGRANFDLLRIRVLAGGR